MVVKPCSLRSSQIKQASQLVVLRTDTDKVAM